MLLGTLGASLSRNILAGKGAMATSHGWGINKKDQGIIRAGQGIVTAGYGNKNNKMDF